MIKKKKRCKNRSTCWCLLGSMFRTFLVDFWRQNGAKLAAKMHRKSISTSEGPFYKKPYKNQWSFDVFLVFGGPTWEQKPTKKRSKNRSKKGGDLSIDFWSILVGLGGQVGEEKRSRIVQKGIEKTRPKELLLKRRLGASWGGLRGCGVLRVTPARH